LTKQQKSWEPQNIALNRDILYTLDLYFALPLFKESNLVYKSPLLKEVVAAPIAYNPTNQFFSKAALLMVIMLIPRNYKLILLNLYPPQLSTHILQWD
jgi:hypothetical protein